MTTILGSSPGPPGGGATSSAPVYRGKQRLYTGKGAKRKLTGFQITFSGALDLVSAINRSHYQLSQPGRTKRSVAKAIALKNVRVSSDGLAVTLTPGKYDAKKPLRLTIDGLLGASRPCSANDYNHALDGSRGDVDRNQGARRLPAKSHPIGGLTRMMPPPSMPRASPPCAGGGGFLLAALARLCVRLGAQAGRRSLRLDRATASGRAAIGLLG